MGNCITKLKELDGTKKWIIIAIIVFVGLLILVSIILVIVYCVKHKKTGFKRKEKFKLHENYETKDINDFVDNWIKSVKGKKSGFAPTRIMNDFYDKNSVVEASHLIDGKIRY